MLYRKSLQRLLAEQMGIFWCALNCLKEKKKKKKREPLNTMRHFQWKDNSCSYLQFEIPDLKESTRLPVQERHNENSAPCARSA